MARRSGSDIVHLKLRFPEFLRRRIANAAKDNNRSMNAEIMHRLLRAYANEDLGEGPAADRFARSMEGLADDIAARVAGRIGTANPEGEDK
jgi:hypothetical protein